MLGIIRNTFSQSLRPNGAIVGGYTAGQSLQQIWFVFVLGFEKWNVGDRLKCVFPKFGAERSHPRRVNGHSKFADVSTFFVSKGEMSGIVWNAFCQSFKPAAEAAEAAASKSCQMFANFGRPFTSRGWLRLGWDLAKTRFRRSPTFHISTLNNFLGVIFSHAVWGSKGVRV